jgi:hypothetical protein
MMMIEDRAVGWLMIDRQEGFDDLVWPTSTTPTVMCEHYQYCSSWHEHRPCKQIILMLLNQRLLMMLLLHRGGGNIIMDRK